MTIPTFKSTSYMLQTNDDVVIFNGASDAIFTLPATKGFGDKYTIKNSGSGSLSVAGFKNDLIEGASSVIMSVGDSKIFYDGYVGKWYLL